jgi:hypothetical protein
MNRDFTSRFVSWTRAIYLALLVSALLPLSGQAASHSYALPDGTLVTMTVETNRTLLTFTGTPQEKFYRLDSTENLVQWVTLDAKFKLNNNGTYTYTDSRALSKCFYRVREL